MDSDGVDLVVYGPGRTSLSLLARSWLEGGGRLVGMAVDPDFSTPVATSIHVEYSPEVEAAALAGFDSFHARIDDEDREGYLSPDSSFSLSEFRVDNFRATLGNTPYRVIVIEDPFPLLVIPVVVGIVAIAGGIRHRETMNRFRDLARDCMNQGGTPTIVDGSGASLTWDGRVKVELRGDSSFTCVMPQKNQ
jgi:hypothetical protein